MNNEAKLEKAKDFINAIREMAPGELNTLIIEVAGEPLADFFINYAATLISRDPSRVLENTSSLMLMGYLIRSQEMGLKLPGPQPTQPQARA